MMVLLLTTLILLAVTPSKVMFVSAVSVKFAPAIVTLVPPDKAPNAGLMLAIVGAGLLPGGSCYHSIGQQPCAHNCQH